MATKKNELALMEQFQIAGRYDGMDPDLLAELQDELADLDEESGITCRTIKLPSGGALAYEVQGEEDDDVEYMKEIKGVIIFTHRMNAYWPGEYGNGDDSTKIPTCSSMDGKTGIVTETGEVCECERCPYNAYGSDTRGGKGKACKNMRRIYLVMDGDPNLYLLTVPPTSIKDVNKQLAKIIAGGTPYTGMVISFKLEKATNANGVAYSKVTVSKAGLLPPAIATQAKQMRSKVKEQYASMAITLGDYAPTPAQEQQPGETGTAEFVEVSGNDDDLPFA